MPESVSSQGAVSRRSMSGAQFGKGSTQKRGRETSETPVAAEDVAYPDSLPSFLSGIKGDFDEVFSAGHTWFQKAFRFLNRSASTPGGDDDLSLLRESSTSKCGKRLKVLSDTEIAIKQNQVEGALRLRCQSKWSEKENGGLLLMPPVQSDTTKVYPSSSSSSVSAPKEKAAGGKGTIRIGDTINLSNLASRPTLKSFPCNDEADVLIVGSRRMILVQILGETGLVKWSLHLEEIESCSIRESKGQNGCLFDCLANERTLSMRMPTSFSCVQILQAIQENREAHATAAENVSASTFHRSVDAQSPIVSESTGEFSSSAVNLMQRPALGPRPDITPMKKTPAKRKAPSESTPSATVGEGYRKALLLSAIKSPKALSPVPPPTSAGPKTVNAGRSRALTRTPPPRAHTLVVEDSETNIVLTPGTFTRVDICARQLRHGVGEMGVRGKLKQDGMSSERVDMIICNALRVIDGAVMCLAPREREVGTLPGADSVEVVAGNRKSAEQQQTPQNGMCHSSKSDFVSTAVPDAQLHGADPTATSAPPVPSDELPPALRKFALMLRHGVPAPAVAAKMTLEGISAAEQSLVLSGGSSSASAPPIAPAATAASEPVAAVPTDELPPVLRKFALMLRHGVPAPAVAAKMTLEGISAAEQSLVLAGGSSSAGTLTVSSAPSIAIAATPTELPAALQKFQKMIKSGVPVQAVKAKMALEGVSASDQALVTGEGGCLGAMAQQQQPKPLQQNPNLPKLLGLHWEPLPPEQFKQTLWGQTASNSLEQVEYEQLASMFSRKEEKKVAPSGGAGEGQSASSVSRETKKGAKSKQPQHIDATRGMNLAIGLAAFKGKNMTVEDIVASVRVMDIDKLGLDGVLRIREMLPSDSESKTLKVAGGQGGVDNLHEAEALLYKLSSIQDVKARVASMQFLCNINSSNSAMLQSFQMLRDASLAALKSEGLAACLSSVLAIGNALNQGTYKGGACGFRLTSLTKLQATKSSDGTSNLVDYLMTLLMTRKQAGDSAASAAIDLPQTLQILCVAKTLSLADLLRDAQALTKDCQSSAKTVKLIDEKATTDDDDQAKRHRRAICELQSVAEEKTGSVQTAANEAKVECENLAKFFGEGPELASTCIAILADFVDALDKARQRFEAAEKKKMMKRK